jgi:hypothetical protein
MRLMPLNDGSWNKGNRKSDTGILRFAQDDDF